MKPLSLALFFGGLFWLIFGVGTWDAICSSVSRFFTGSLAEKTVWLLIGGIAATALGIFGLHHASKA